MAGRLADFLPAWRRVTDDDFVLSVVRLGYRIEFLSPPPFNGIRATNPPLAQADTLSEEVAALLQKQAIRPVPPQDQDRGYYSTYFLVPKKDGGFRPILNLRWLNLSVRYRRFRMETLRTIIGVVRPGMWMASIDLKDAYFHIPINGQHHCFLRFMFRGVVYEFVCLPFGLSSAPWLFTKVLLPVLAFLRRQGIMVFAYLDDLLVLAASPEELATALEQVKATLESLGFLINIKKSEFTPTQRLVYVGGEFDTSEGLVRLPPRRCLALSTALQSFLKVGALHPARLFMKVLGLMAATIDVVPHARYRMRPLQWHLHDRWTVADGYEAPILVTRQLVEDCRWWLHEPNLRRGVPLEPRSPQATLVTDASLYGWGAHLVLLGGERQSRPLLLQGAWSVQETTLHINVLELRAVRLALSAFAARVAGKEVQLQSDNTATVAYINHQGGLKSRSLYTEFEALWQFVIPHNITLRASHLAGVDNLLADFLSRHRADPTEWALSRKVARRLFSLWGTPQIDLFANTDNHLCPAFCSLHPAPAAVCHDGLQMSWTGIHSYAFPPFALLTKVLAKVRDEKAELTLVAPNWPRRPWFPLLLSLLVDVPRLLPLQQDLLSQVLPAKGRLFHQDIRSLHLTAWRLSGVPSRHRAFLRRLATSRCQPSGPLPEASTTRGGLPSTVGVRHGISIPLQRL